MSRMKAGEHFKVEQAAKTGKGLTGPRRSCRHYMVYFVADGKGGAKHTAGPKPTEETLVKARQLSRTRSTEPDMRIKL